MELKIARNNTLLKSIKNRSNNKIIFLHIPKAAGSTLNLILGRKYKKLDTFEIDGSNVKESIERFKQLSLKKRSKIKILKGHMPFGLHKYLSGNFRYITLVRNPIDRMVSHYYYVIRNPEHFLYPEVTKKKMVLEEYIESGISVELDNHQVRMIAGHASEDDIGYCSSELLEKAKFNLQNFFSVVGLTEYFDETLMLLKREFSWWGYPLYHKDNVTKGRPSLGDIPRKTKKKIEKFNEFDCELYEYAKKLFKAKMDSKFHSIKSDLKIFAFLNFVFQIYKVFK